jgi:Domain of unknown function (DUF4219)
MEETKSYSIEKLNETHYRSWPQVLESHLDDQELWEVVNGTVKQSERPETPTSTFAAQTTDQTAAATADYERKLEERTKKAKKQRKLMISTNSPSVMTYI